MLRYRNGGTAPETFRRVKLKMGLRSPHSGQMHGSVEVKAEMWKSPWLAVWPLQKMTLHIEQTSPANQSPCEVETSPVSLVVIYVYDDGH